MTNEKKTFTVLIEGNIGCGKTTLLKHFASDSASFEEPVNLWQNVNGHNLLQLLYGDPKRWASLFQSYVMLTTVKNHLTNCAGAVKIMERSLFSSQYCFATNFYQTGKLNDPEYQILGDWLKFLTTTPQLGLSVDLIIYLRIQPEVALERIKTRGREEEVNISLSYLQALHDCHENWLLNHQFPVPAPVIVIDANQTLPEIKLDYLKYQDFILGKNKLSL